MTNLRNYNITYSKTVRARYLKNYKKTELYIITASKEIYFSHLKYIRKNYSKVITERDGEHYIIRAYNLLNLLESAGCFTIGDSSDKKFYNKESDKK